MYYACPVVRDDAFREDTGKRRVPLICVPTPQVMYSTIDHRFLHSRRIVHFETIYGFVRNSNPNG